MIDKKMREGRNVTCHDTIQGSVSIAEELSKLVKLKEKGVITEEEFSQNRIPPANNLSLILHNNR